ncbi:MAG: hypothetical protein JRI68_19125 [Deltaproteobacteria bacterium]|nr:hypothetical protein [Deltaproteobacteria bacterium]
MELDVSKLAADGFAITLDGPEATQRRITLGPTSQLSGTVGSNDRAVTVDLGSPAALPLTDITWPLARGLVALEGTARVTQPRVKLTFPRGGGGAEGEVATREITLPGVVLELDSFAQPLKARGLTLSHTGLALDGKGAIGIVAKTIVAEHVELGVGGTRIDLGQLVLEGVRFHRASGKAWKLEVQTLRAERASVDRQGTSVVLDAPVLEQVLARSGGRLEVGKLTTPAVRVRHDLSTVPKGGSPKKAAKPNQAAATSQAAGPRRAPLDWSALDRLCGKVDVDLTADATVPVIGSRRATHHFRLAVDHGKINYYRLEKSLSRLEDALLDFEVRGSRLVLEVDLALKKKTLVSWRLNDEEVDLAHQRQVRLRRLIRYELPRSPSAKSGPPAVALRELGLDNVDIALKLLGGSTMKVGGGTLFLGVRRQSAIAALRLRGQLGHRPQGRAPKGQLDLTAERLSLGADQLPIGSRRLTVAALRVGAIQQGVLQLVGVRPKTLSATLDAVSLEQLVLAPPR